MAQPSIHGLKIRPYSPLSWLFVLVNFWSFGCSTLTSVVGEDPPVQPSPPEPTVITLKLETSQNLNLNPDGKATPLVARIYELKSSDGFTNADFFTIYNRDKDVLGSDVGFRKELDLTPGQKREVRFEPKPDSRFIGVFGAFRDLETAQWRAVLEIPADKKPVMRVLYSKNSVTIEVLKENPPSK